MLQISQNANIALVDTIERDPMQDVDNTKKQTTIYVDKSLLKDVRKEVSEAKDIETDYSQSRFFDEAAKLYFMVLKQHRQSRSTLPVFDFAQSAIRSYLDTGKRRF